jgi:magnesium-transporting ATPase (P-type)
VILLYIPFQFVPETIKALMAADIRVWILTGDKRETAINIAQSSGLCTKTTRLLTLDIGGLEAVIAKLQEFNDTVSLLNIEGVLTFFLGATVSISWS